MLAMLSVLDGQGGTAQSDGEKLASPFTGRGRILVRIQLDEDGPQRWVPLTGTKVRRGLRLMAAHNPGGFLMLATGHEDVDGLLSADFLGWCLIGKRWEDYSEM